MQPDPAEAAPPDEDGTTAEPWLTRRQRRALQRVFSQALGRPAGKLRRRCHQRPKHYTGAREPVRVARERAARALAQGGTTDGR